MQENIDPQLKSRYRSEQMRKVLAASLRLFPRTFITNGGVRSPYFYESEHAVVFPPCSDTEGTGMETITQVLAQAKPHLIDHASKCFLFPLAEERGAFLSWGPSRKHWVTLHYDPSTQIATVIDSRPTLVSYWYICQPIRNFLNAGLQALGLPHPVKKFNVVYQGIQHDDIRCGPWTAANIERLACGFSIETQLTCFTAQDSEGIVQHHIDRLYYKKSQPYRSYQSLTEASSNDTIAVEDDDDNDYAVVSMSNAASVLPPLLMGGTSGERLVVSDEEDELIQEPMDFDSDADEGPVMGGLLVSSENLMESEQHVVMLVPLQETDDTIQPAASRRVLETVHSEISHFPVSGAASTVSTSSSGSAQFFETSMETIQIEAPDRPSQFQPNVRSETSQLVSQRNPGISGSMFTEKPMVRVIPKEWVNGGNVPPSSSFQLQFIYGLMLLGGLSLMIAFLLSVPSVASSMVVTMALGSATSKVALGAAVVSGLSFLTGGFLFYQDLGKTSNAYGLKASKKVINNDAANFAV